MQDCLSYLRVSGKGQINGDGFPRQRDAVARYARANGLTIVDEYRDEGVSGTKDIGDRPGLATLLDRVESNGIRVVLVERADRLARDLMISEVILGQFRAAGVRVIAADGGGDLTVDDDDPTRTLIRQVLGAVAQFDKSVTVAKLRAARDRIRRKTGRCEGRKCFGHRPGERDTIARIHLLRNADSPTPMSYARIAAMLNADHTPTQTGKPWHAATIRNILMRADMV